MFMKPPINLVINDVNNPRLTINNNRITIKMNESNDELFKLLKNIAIWEFYDYAKNKCQYTIRGRFIKNKIKWDKKHYPKYKTMKGL